MSEEKKSGRLQDYGTRKDYVEVDPYIIEVDDGFNKRDFNLQRNADHIRFLANSIKTNGFTSILSVIMDGSRIVLTDGECRLRAVKLALEEGWEPAASQGKKWGVPCRVDPNKAAKGNRSERLLTIAIANSGLNLDPLEEAELVREWSAAGWEVDYIAKRTGWPASRVRAGMALVAAPDALRMAVRRGELAVTEMMRLLKEKTPEEAIALVERAKQIQSVKLEEKNDKTKLQNVIEGSVEGEQKENQTESKSDDKPQKLTQKLSRKKLDEAEGKISGRELLVMMERLLTEAIIAIEDDAKQAPDGFKSWEDWCLAARKAVNRER